MVNDPVREFEKRRNEPTRYNRITMIKTIQAMKRIEEIKTARQARFWEKRMAASKHVKIKMVERELEKHVDLIDDETIKSKVLEKIQAKHDLSMKKSMELVEYEKVKA